MRELGRIGKCAQWTTPAGFCWCDFHHGGPKTPVVLSAKIPNFEQGKPSTLRLFSMNEYFFLALGAG